jgi:hypothetical protein
MAPKRKAAATKVIEGLDMPIYATLATADAETQRQFRAYAGGPGNREAVTRFCTLTYAYLAGREKVDKELWTTVSAHLSRHPEYARHRNVTRRTHTSS